MAKLINELEPQSKRKILVFDTFSGLPDPVNEDGDYAKTQIGRYSGNKKSMEKMIDLYNLEHRLELIEGDACNTITEFFTEDNPALVSLAYFDFDLYEPTKIAYEHIKSRLSKGSLLVFDEGLDRDLWPGQCKVVKEILNDTFLERKFLSIPNKFLDNLKLFSSYTNFVIYKLLIYPFIDILVY